MTEEPDDVTEVKETAEEVEPTAAEVEDAEAPSRRSPGGLRRLVIPVVVSVLLVASIAFASWVYFADFRPDLETNAAASASALSAAKDGTVALLSYSPESLDQDFATAKSHLTGEFLNYYTQFTQDIVTPAAKQKNVKTSAQVVSSAVSELTPASAEVLVFINQSTTSNENPDGSFTASSVKVGLTKVDGTWLIDAFDPV